MFKKFLDDFEKKAHVKKEKMDETKDSSSQKININDYMKPEYTQECTPIPQKYNR